LDKDLEGVEAFQQLQIKCGHPMAKAGLEMALWDILGKQQKRSLRSLLEA
jgi:L-alanine-DL-glutamate epimerase-like enolase superfamily enzyme